MSRKLNRAKALLFALACGGVTLVTTATCDPNLGILDFYHGHDGYYYDGYYTDAYYVDYSAGCDFFFCL